MDKYQRMKSLERGVSQACYNLNLAQAELASEAIQDEELVWRVVGIESRHQGRLRLELGNLLIDRHPLYQMLKQRGSALIASNCELRAEPLNIVMLAKAEDLPSLGIRVSIAAMLDTEVAKADAYARAQAKQEAEDQCWLGRGGA